MVFSLRMEKNSIGDNNNDDSDNDDESYEPHTDDKSDNDDELYEPQTDDHVDSDNIEHIDNDSDSSTTGVDYEILTKQMTTEKTV